MEFSVSIGTTDEIKRRGFKKMRPKRANGILLPEQERIGAVCGFRRTSRPLPTVILRRIKAAIACLQIFLAIAAYNSDKIMTME